jgi:hypothetical protein
MPTLNSTMFQIERSVNSLLWQDLSVVDLVQFATYLHISVCEVQEGEHERVGWV